MSSGSQKHTLWWWGVLLLGLWLFLAKPYLHSGFPHTHDGENHLARFANYKLAIKDGQIPPRWAPNLLQKYGYPVFNYNYPLANILSVPFSALDVPYETTFKILAASALILGLAGAKKWLSLLTNSPGVQGVSVAIFASSPYIYSNVVFRGNIGEVLAWSILPWLLVAVETLKHNHKLAWWWSIPAACFLLSHNIMAMFGFGLVLTYAATRLPLTKKTWWSFSYSWLIATAASLWFWLPALLEKHWVVLDQADLSVSFGDHFAAWPQLWLSPLQGGYSFPGSIDSISMVTSLSSAAILFLGSWWLVREKNEQTKKLLVLSWVTALVATLLLQLSFSEPIWKLLPFLRFVQFVWRLGWLVPIVTAGLAAILLPKLSKLIWWSFIALVVWQFLAWSRVKPVDYFHKPVDAYDTFSQTTSTGNENMPQSFKYQDLERWEPKPELVNGRAEVVVYSWGGRVRQYRVMALETVTLAEPTANFPGWRTEVVDMASTDTWSVTYVDDQKIAGRVAFQLTPGDYIVTTHFTQGTWPRVIGNGIGILVWIYWIVLFLKSVTKKTLKELLIKPWFLLAAWFVLMWLLSFSASTLLLDAHRYAHWHTILPATGLPKWLYSWANFDGVHYITIVDKGYFGTGLIQAFFPLFPLLAKPIAVVTGQAFWGLWAVSLSATLGLGMAWQWLLGKKLGFWSWVAIMSFPTAFFFHATYSESLFLVLVLLSLTTAQKGKWGWAVATAALASATRVVGVALVPALLVEAWWQEAGHSTPIIVKNALKWPVSFTRWLLSHPLRVLFIMLGSVGLLSYMIYLQWQFQDPWYFFHVQSEFGAGRQESIVILPQVIWRYTQIFLTYRPFGWEYYAFVQEFLLSGIAGVLLLIASLKVRPSWTVFGVAAWIVPTLTGSFSSMPRYVLVCVPIFVVLGQWLESHPKWRPWYFMGVLAWLCLNTVLFIQGYWIA